MEEATDITAAARRRKSTPAQVGRVAERRRERKAERRTPAQRLAARQAEKLHALASDPDFAALRPDLYRLILRVRNLGNRTPDRDVEAVTAAITRGCNAVEDIVEETDLSESDVLKVLDGMLSVGAVKQYVRRRPDVDRAPVEYLYHLSEDPLRTDMVLP